MQTKLVILDRDGTINRASDQFVKSPEEWEPLPGALEAIGRLNHAGYHVVLASNQSGLGRGLLDMAALNAVHDTMTKALARVGARVDAIFYCPHAADEACHCRKPEPGMILRAAREHGLSLAHSFMVGDKPSDIEAARAAGVGRAYIVQSDNEESTDGLAGADAAYADLAACVDALLKSA